MNILLLTHRVPHPPNRGDRIRSCHLLQFLSDRANVHLGCLADEALSVESQAWLDRHCAGLAVEPLALAIPLATVFQVGPFVLIANSLPITPGGAGVGEAASHTLFGALNFAGGGEAMVILRIAVILTSMPAIVIASKSDLLTCSAKETVNKINRSTQ